MPEDEVGWVKYDYKCQISSDHDPSSTNQNKQHSPHSYDGLQLCTSISTPPAMTSVMRMPMVMAQIGLLPHSFPLHGPHGVDGTDEDEEVKFMNIISLLVSSDDVKGKISPSAKDSFSQSVGK